MFIPAAFFLLVGFVVSLLIVSVANRRETKRYEETVRQLHTQVTNLVTEVNTEKRKRINLEHQGLGGTRAGGVADLVRRDILKYR